MNKLNVVFCWHMHQPDYRGPNDSEYQLPWVYLHGIKDYSDMAAHLEAEPGARAVVNFAPVLLEQIADYASQIRRWFETGEPIRDPLLAALAGPKLSHDLSERRALIRACLRANESQIINRFPHYRELADMAQLSEEHEYCGMYLSDQFLADLLVWHHLGWFGETIRQNDVRIRSLEKKTHGFSTEDRRSLMRVIGETLAGLVGRYRRLVDAGRVELSVTPYAHPILPLLIDIESAREAMPEILLPELKQYPGGEERARWHIRNGIAAFEKHFGAKPAGCWPSEGAICEETVRILEEEGLRWAASGQQVLHNSLTVSHRGKPPADFWLHAPYRVKEGRLNCFFRDDGLSDLIGFTYSEWHADDAVANLIQHLENIAQANEHRPDAIVSVIMDGENAWEYYPNNGHFFLSALYKQLAKHPKLELTTFSEYLDRQKKPAADLSRLVAGSWVYGTLSTWIGEPDKNLAWDMLGEAKAAYDRELQRNRFDDEARQALDLQLAKCEGSDWFWWFGDYNPASTVSDFESLYRVQLTHLYRMLGVEAPEYLSRVFAHGTGAPELGGVMKRN